MLAKILYSKNEYLSISLAVFLIRLIRIRRVDSGFEAQRKIKEKYPTFLLGLWLCVLSAVIWRILIVV